MDNTWQNERIYKNAWRAYVWTGTTTKWRGLDNRLIDVSGTAATDMSSKARAYGNRGITIGNNAVSTDGLAIGLNSSASADGIAIGNAAKATESKSISIGSIDNAGQNYGISIGYNSAALDRDSIVLGADATAETGIAIGKGATTGALNGVTIGKNNTAGGKYSRAIGGKYSQAYRTTELSYGISEANYPNHNNCSVHWSGYIDTILGAYEIFLAGINQDRFILKTNSVVSGLLYINGVRDAGGSEIFSAIYHIAVYMGANFSTIVLKRNQTIDVYNDDVGILNASFQVDITDGSLRLFVQSGSAVRAYNTKWTATFIYNETVFA